MMKIETHKLTAYALGELDAAEAEAVEAFAMNHPEAQREIEAIQGTAHMLTAKFTNAATPKLDAARRDAILDQVQPQTSPIARIGWLAPVAAAAVVAVAVGLIGIYAGNPNNTPSGNTNGAIANNDNFNEPIPTGTPREIDDAQTLPAGYITVEIDLPPATFVGTPADIKAMPRMQPFAEKDRQPLAAPKGTELLSRNKPVTSSSSGGDIIGELADLTDGKKDVSADANTVTLDFDKEWVQIDLQQQAEVYGVVVWLNFQQPRVYRDVIVQVSDDPDFIEGVTTVFNNDHDNSYGLGIGNDPEFLTENYGKLIRADGVKGRYIRVHSNGNNEDDQNVYVEIEVFGKPSASAAWLDEGETFFVALAADDAKNESSGKDLVEIEFDLPKAQFVGTPKSLKDNPRMQKEAEKDRGKFMAPKGTTNVAKGAKVTSSSTDNIGELEQITDGDKEAVDGSYVTLDFDKQWVQVDLGGEKEIYGILMWHYFFQPRIYRDVIIQSSNDPDFIEGVEVLFNNDHDNSYGLGVGEDFEYLEEHWGKLFRIKGVKARYLRFHTQGNSEDDQNHYTEIEVYGKDAK